MPSSARDNYAVVIIITFLYIYLVQNGILSEKQANKKMLNKKPPSEDDFEAIKLISNGAYG